MRPLAIFYHCLLVGGEPADLLPNAFEVVGEQMECLRKSGLIQRANCMVVGINGGNESHPYANLLLPPSASRIMHGLQSRNENSTLVAVEKFCAENRGWNVLYFHSKGATHSPGSEAFEHRKRWRLCGMKHLITNWKRCVGDLNAFESVGCHWYTDQYKRSYWAGNFWWARSEFLCTVPAIQEQWRIKHSGIDALESRYEAEVWIGGGRHPTHKDYHPVSPTSFNACL